MTNNKQSSVDFLFQNMFEISQTLVTGMETQYQLMEKAYEQAKEMEKQRMFDFAKSFVYTWNYITKGNFESTKDMNKELENLFEETYGGVNK